jgi:cystathionine beta-synthase (O-acetyl-L-serine)
MNKINVFEGVEEFLNPANHLPCSLVKLPGRLHCFPEEVDVYAKLMFDFLTVKSWPAWNIIDQASKKGALKGKHTILDNTSGNMGFSLAFLANLKQMGFVPIIPSDLALGKRQMLNILGLKPIETDELPNESSGIVKARRLGELRGIFCPNQYGNEDNPAVYEKRLGPEIFKQMGGNISAIVASVGTGGTLVGLSRYYKRLGKKIVTVGALCEDGAAIPGVRSMQRMKDVTLPWKKSTPHFEEISTKAAFYKSLRAVRIGILMGPSSGAAIAAVDAFLMRAKKNPVLWKSLPRYKGKIRVVFICPDTAFPYLDKYTTHLNPQDLAPEFSPKISSPNLAVFMGMLD